MDLGVYPWSIWAEASAREYPYGDIGFIILTVVAISYLIIMWYVGSSFLKTYKLYPGRKEYKYLGLGFLIVAFFDTLHVFGDIAFYFTNDSRVIIELGGGNQLYYLPLATSLSVMGIFIFFAGLYLYSLEKIGAPRGLIDNVFFALVVLGIIMGLNPYNFWHMIAPENAFDTKPVTGILLLIVGLLAIFKFKKTIERIIGEVGEESKHREIRAKLITYSLFLIALLVILMVPHGMLATIEADWAKIAMIIVTIFKLTSLASSALLLYAGTVWPSWAEKLFGGKL